MKCKSDGGECGTGGYCEQCDVETAVNAPIDTTVMHNDWDGKTCHACGKSYHDPSYYGFPTCEDCEA